MKIFEAFGAWALLTLAAYAQEAGDPCASVTVTFAGQDIPCATIGSLTIDSSLSGDLHLDSVRQIQELSIRDNTGLEQLTSTSLTRVDDSIYIRDTASLKEIRFPELTTIGNIVVAAAPKLETLILGGASFTVVGYISITNTAVVELELHPVAVDYLTIKENPSLKRFSSTVQRIVQKGEFDLPAWGSLVDLPSMVWANILRISHSAGVSLESLVSVNESFGLDNNAFKSLSVPALQSVGDSLSVTQNSALVEVDFSQLERIGDSLTVASNPAISELDGFPKLKDVSGKVVLEGNFTYVEMPALSNAADGLWVTSSKNISYSCAALEKVFQSERPHQSFRCQGAVDGGTGGTSVVASGTQSLYGGIIAGIVVGALAALAALGIIVAAILILCRRRKARKRAAVARGASISDVGGLQDPECSQLHPDKPELEGVPRSELASPDPELEGSRVPNDAVTVYHEMDATAREKRGWRL